MMQVIGFLLLVLCGVFLTVWVMGPDANFRNPMLYCYWLIYTGGILWLGTTWGGVAIIVTVVAITIGAYLHDCSQQPVRVTLKRPWEIPDKSDPDNHEVVTVQPGTYELEKIENPVDYMRRYQPYWLVLKGTKIGWTRAAWLSWQGEDWGDYEIVVEGVPWFIRALYWRQLPFFRRIMHPGFPPIATRP